MTKITNARIIGGTRTATDYSLRITADVQFTGSDLSQGQSGAAAFRVSILLWDEDTFSDDRIVRHWVTIPKEKVAAHTPIDNLFKVSWSTLRSKEPFYEGGIELYGELRLFRGDHDTGITAKTGTKDVDFPTAATTAGQHIEVTTEGSAGGTICVVKGSKFKGGARVVLRFTDAQLRQQQSSATATASGTFTARVGVPCVAGGRSP